MIREVGNKGSEKSFSSFPFTKALKSKVDEDIDEAARIVKAERPLRNQPVGLAQTREIEFERIQHQAAEHGLLRLDGMRGYLEGPGLRIRGFMNGFWHVRVNGARRPLIPL